MALCGEAAARVFPIWKCWADLSARMGAPSPSLPPESEFAQNTKHALDARHKWRRDIKRIKELGPSKDGSRREGVTYRIKLCISPPTPAYTG